MSTYFRLNQRSKRLRESKILLVRLEIFFSENIVFINKIITKIHNSNWRVVNKLGFFSALPRIKILFN